MEEKLQKQSKKELAFEILRFFVVSVIATLADYIVYFLFKYLLKNTVLSVIISTAAGFLTGLIINYILSIIYVYKNVKNKNETKTFKAFLIFTAIGLLGLLITETGMLLKHLLLPEYYLTILNYNFDLIELIAKCCMTLLVAIWNYIGRKVFIFK